MSFGYYQGQETQALAYYQKLLEGQADPETRHKLEQLIAELQKFINRRQQEQELKQTQSGGGLVQHALP